MGTEDEVELSLELYRLDFERTRNPLSLFGAFVYAHGRRKTPPIWAIEHMAAVFTRYADCEGAVSLDKLLGLKRGKGQAPAIKETKRQTREMFLMLDICTLKSFFNVSTSEAAEMVAQRVRSEKPAGQIDEEDEIKRDDQDSAFSSTLADKYSRFSWQEKFTVDPYLSFLLSLNLSTDKLKFLQQFPRDSWPHKLKREYK